MDPERLGQLIAEFPSRRIAVVGDFFLDKYLDVDPGLAEVSVETGKVAHQVVAVRTSPGAAGTVVNNLAALQAGVMHAVGSVGDDGEGFALRRELEKRGCTTDGLIASERLMTPTYLKPRDAGDPSLSGEHQRYDTKNRRPTPSDLIERVLAALDGLLPDVDAVIIADQVEQDECGVVTSAMRDALAERAQRHRGVVFWADSRARIGQFRRVIIKPNQFEAVGRSQPAPQQQPVDLKSLRQAATELRGRNQAAVCITRGPAGMLVSDPELTEVAGVHLEGPLDPTGAGDSATAGAVLALASGASLPEAALVGILASSITVQQLATTGTASPAELLKRLKLWREQHIEA